MSASPVRRPSQCQRLLSVPYSVAAVLAVLAMLVAASTAHADVQVPVGFTVSSKLSAPASLVAGKPVKVWCATTRAAFASAASETAGNVDAAGFAVPGTSAEYLPPVACGALHAWLNHRHVDDYTFAVATLVLAHEASHLRGVTDEGATDCVALAKLPTMIRRYFPVKGHGIDVATLMLYAHDAHDREGAAYHTGVCG